MVLLTTTPRMLSAISLLAPSDIELIERDALPKSISDPISHGALINIARLLRSKTSSAYQKQQLDFQDDLQASKYTLSVLLQGAQPYIPPPPPPLQKTASYVALRARLLADQEARTYNSLFSPSIPAAQLSPNSAQGNGDDDDDEDDISPSLIFNIFLSILLCGLAVWYTTRFWSNDGTRVLVSMASSVIVGSAEVGVFAAYLRKAKTARTRERRKKEVKTVVREYRGDDAPGTARATEDDAGDAVDVANEQEVIWGKGINGGIRRRVREKWEKARDQPEGPLQKE